MQRTILKLAALSAVLGALLLVMLSQRQAEGPLHATLLPQPRELPAFALVDQNGSPFGREAFAGRVSLVFFGFTHCPDICPATLQQLAFARRELSESLPPAELPAIVFVSVDPERDDVESVAAYVDAFGDGIDGLTGPLEEIDKLTRALGIFHSRAPQPEGGYQVEHSAAVIVIDRQGRYRAVFSAPHETEAFARDTLYMIENT